MFTRVVNSLASKLGYEVSISRRGADQFGYDLAAEANESIKVIRSHTMLPYQRLVTLYQQAVFCEAANLAGSFVECGTWKGGAVGLMALANLRHGSARRHLHLFDSFEGIPEPDESVDGQRATEFARSAGGGVGGNLVALEGTYGAVGTLEVNRELLEQTIGYDKHYLHYHKGWFQDTLPEQAAEVGEIAILRLDGDWYSSTKVCLEYLYERVVGGGFVVLDDYGWYEGCKKAVDEFMEREGIRAFLNHIDNSGRYWIKS
jgi:O-methyltransferase